MDGFTKFARFTTFGKLPFEFNGNKGCNDEDKNKLMQEDG
jgi:hypothetical protein